MPSRVGAGIFLCLGNYKAAKMVNKLSISSSSSSAFILCHTKFFVANTKSTKLTKYWGVTGTIYHEN